LRNKLTFYFAVFVVLLSAGLATSYYSFQPDSPASIASEIADNLQRELTKVEEDLSNISSSDNDFHEIEADYPFFVYKDNRLIYWSDNRFVPPVYQVTDTFNIKLISTGSEAFLIKKLTMSDDQYIISTILLNRKYPINNDYLKPEWNERIFSSGNISILESGASIGIPICLENNCFFRISFQQADFPSHTKIRKTALAIFVLAFIFFVLLIYEVLGKIGHRFPEFGFFYLYSVFMLLRLVMTQLNFPNAIVNTSLFDPQVFASSSLNASLGDLFINLLAILACCYYVFKNYFRFYVLRYRNHRIISWIISIVSVLCVLFAGLFPFVIIQTLYNNSSIALDISQSLKFDLLRVVAILTVVISGICSFLFSHAFIRILSSDRSRIRAVLSFLIALVLFVIINTLTRQQHISSLIVTFIYCIVVYALQLYSSLKRLSYATFAYLFASIFFISVNGAYAIQYFTHREKIESQFRFASNFLIDRDIFGEYLLHETSHKIGSDAFTQARITSPFLGKEAIRQKIRQIFLPSYFNKYDVEIFIFNGLGEPIDNTTNATLSDFISQYDRDAFRTEYESVFFVNNPELDVTQKYLIVVPVQRMGMISGHIIVQLSLKKIIPDNVYPELLVDHDFQQFYRTQDLSYAVFANKKIAFTSGEFNYERLFDRSWMGHTSLYTTGISHDGYDHIAQEDQGGRVAIVSSEKVPFIYKLANFSFLLVLGLSIILAMIFVQGVYYYFKGNKLFFTARIQLYLNLAFFLPLIIVSITTLGLTSRSSQEQLNDEYLNKNKTFGQQMTYYMDDYLQARDENLVTLSNHLGHLAKLSNLDANIYNASGILIATSQPLIVENNLVSSYMNPDAYTRITRGENLFIESDEIGSLEYFVSYATLKSPQTGNVLGILGIPFFQSAYLMEKIQIVILANILNIFAFIFIVLLVLSYFVAEWLTFPLRFITQSLRKTSLTKINTPLTWNAEDEIGLMVKEYNAMLFKLSESKSELEQTQREKAWREIAQQVAHEIKNPLTPMKLTLQQLERNLQSGNNTPEKTQRAITTLLTQVDTLNDIASSFSGFAKMPEPVIHRVDLVSLVKRAVDLHSPTGEINFKTVVKEALIMGDDQLLSRTFSNIILNGLQSGKPGQSIQVNVSIEKTNGFFRIAFQDNGKGIEPQIADRVFTPHFSTKKSGSGLGLAIAKQAIEQMQGKIWFETETGKGTSFFIDLPEIQ
jgi:two-component system, NtrC family, nitrogen regulation sensor histidine kinase NtrY